MPLDQIENFVRGSTDTSVDGTQTTISVVDATVYPDPANGEYNLVFWDDVTYPRPDQDPDVEIVRVTARDTGTNNLTVSRAQEGTNGASHPDNSALQLSPTAAQFGKIAPTDQAVEDFTTNSTTSGVVPVSQGDGSLLMDSPPTGDYNDLSSRPLRFTNSFDVSGEDALPRSITWNDTGSKFYVGGGSNSNIYSYNLTTNFDISTASYSGTSFDVSGEGTFRGMEWNNTGSKFYTCTSSPGEIHSYDLTTNFDISTASYSGTSFSIDSEDSQPRDVAWNDTGSKMYVMGGNIYSYDLTTNFDISTASYSGTSFDVSAANFSPTGLTWNNDGSIFHVQGYNDADVSGFECATAYDISTATFSGGVLDVSGEDQFPEAVAWNDTGSKMYIVGGSNDSVYSYTRITTLPF